MEMIAMSFSRYVDNKMELSCEFAYDNTRISFCEKEAGSADKS